MAEGRRLPLSEYVKVATAIAPVLFAGTLAVADKADLIDVRGFIHKELDEARTPLQPSNAVAGNVYRWGVKYRKDISEMCSGLNNAGDPVKRAKDIEAMEKFASDNQAENEAKISKAAGEDVLVAVYSYAMCDTNVEGDEHVYKSQIGFGFGDWPRTTTCILNNVESPPEDEIGTPGVDVLSWACKTRFSDSQIFETVNWTPISKDGFGVHIAATK